MSKDINDLHPALQPLCRQFLAICGQEDLDARILFTFRTPDEQDAIYAQGRTKPGKIVTMLDGRHSLHCWTFPGDTSRPASKAFDFGIFRDNIYITDGDDPDYEKAGEIGERLGLTWGGRWVHPFDPSHLQIT